jgi:hypothetical protein
MPTYAKSFKEILTNRRELEDVHTITLTEEVSALVMNKLPPKLKKPTSFTISCSIKSVNTYQALCDLGASISLMPKLNFEKMGIYDLLITYLCNWQIGLLGYYWV